MSREESYLPPHGPPVGSNNSTTTRRPKNGNGISAFRSTSQKPWNNKDDDDDLVDSHADFHRGVNSCRRENQTAALTPATTEISMTTEPRESTMRATMTTARAELETSAIDRKQSMTNRSSFDRFRDLKTNCDGNGNNDLTRNPLHVPGHESSASDGRGSSYARYLVRQQQQQLEQKQKKYIKPHSDLNAHISQDSSSSPYVQRITYPKKNESLTSSMDRAASTSARPPRGSSENPIVLTGSRHPVTTTSSSSLSSGIAGNRQRDAAHISDPEIQRSNLRSKFTDRTASISLAVSAVDNNTSTAAISSALSEEREQKARELRANRIRMERIYRNNDNTAVSTTRVRNPAVEAYLSTRNSQTANDSNNNTTSQNFPRRTSPHSLPPMDARDRIIPSNQRGSFHRNTDPNTVSNRIASNRKSLFPSSSPPNTQGRTLPTGRSARSNKSIPNDLYSHSTLSSNGDRVVDLISSSSSSSSEETDTISDEEEKDGSSIHDERSWSVRVCVVSAVDLPANVVPNIPLSPVLKLGLIPVSQNYDRKTDQVKRSKENRGSLQKKSSRVRCTACKILSRRDNGSVEFHEELRWDRVLKPQAMALSVELCARGVLAPKNYKESPLSNNSKSIDEGSSSYPNGQTRTNMISTTTKSSQDRSRIGKFWKKGREQEKNMGKSSEMATANAAAAVAKLLMEDPNKSATITNSDATSTSQTFTSCLPPLHENELDVQLSKRGKSKKQTNRHRTKLTEDVPLGSINIPLTDVPQIDKVVQDGAQTARIERWYELDNVNSSCNQTGISRAPPSSKVGRRNPSILLEISFYAPQALDDSEDDMDDETSDTESSSRNAASGKGKKPESIVVSKKLSFQKRQSIEVRHLLNQEKMQKEENLEDPVLEPGVIDYVCVVGARDIGNQKNDDGSKGWVNSTPECSLLEQFPPKDFHSKNDRGAVVPEKIEWFCFPEGCRLWRGTKPPSHEDLKLNRFAASLSAKENASVASFDACLNCATSLSWFVISSVSDKYGAENVKTYGAVIRFYVAAPAGIDPTQDDYAQTIMSSLKQSEGAGGFEKGGSKRLWVPIGICLTSSLPIVGTMEAMLLRLCKTLGLKQSMHLTSTGQLYKTIHRDIANLIMNFQKPIPRVVNCSIPFLQGKRFHLSLQSSYSLPPLPHGNAVAAVCRLLGPDGLNFLLAAILTECKILLHSDDTANLPLVAEVITALMFPFSWPLPYIPILPSGMLEYVEAPVPYLLGIPSCCVKDIDHNALEDVVVVNLDNGVSLIRGKKTKVPTPLPAMVASNISKAVYRLLRAEEADEFGSRSLPVTKLLLRQKNESHAEREFRITVAIELCGLVRGYQDCVVFVSTSQPVFNRDKFLKKAPALFEERRMNAIISAKANSRPTTRWVLSPRSKKFLSLLVNCQHFQQFLETLGNEDSSVCFHEVIGMWYKGDDKKTAQSLTDIGFSCDLNKALSYLTKYFRKVDEVVPTYVVDHISSNMGNEDCGDVYSKDTNNFDQMNFPNNLLLQIVASNDNSNEKKSGNAKDDVAPQVRSISVQYLLELEKNPWRYNKLFDISCEAEKKNDSNAFFQIMEKVKLRDAIGERRYRAWQRAKKHNIHNLDAEQSFDDIDEASTSIDLTSLLSSTTEDTVETSSTESSFRGASSKSLQTSSLNPEKQKVADAKDRDVLRRCLERAYSCKRTTEDGSNPSFSSTFMLNGRDLVAQAEVSLRNPSGQRFLLSILGKRWQNDQQRKQQQSGSRRRHKDNVSRLEPIAFECIVRLCCAMLDSCMEIKEYEPAYCLLSHTTGLYTMQVEKDSTKIIESIPFTGEEEEKDVSLAMYVTARIALHPLFADLGLWEKVMNLHILDRQQNVKKSNEDAGGKAVTNSGGFGDGKEEQQDKDVQYEAAVATLYEMLGYGIPSEELARFATYVSEKQDWFSTERGRALLLLARRVSIRREQSVHQTTGKTGDLDIMQGKSRKKQEILIGQPNKNYLKQGSSFLDNNDDEENSKIIEISWCHPSAPTSRRLNMAEPVGRPGTQSLLNMLDDQKKAEVSYMKRSAVTALSSFGSSVVVSGGLDGGVFLAHTIIAGNDDSDGSDSCKVRGLHLDWGSSGSRSVAGSASTSLDGEYGVGAVSCLAASKGSTYREIPGVSSKKDTTGPLHNDDVLSSMEGSRVVAGTTCGDLRVWSVKDVYSAISLTNVGDESTPIALNEARYLHAGSEGTSSSYVKRTDYASNGTFNRLKFSLRGRALSGHRGGVTCIDVPSHVYHPDSVVTGGADGLIKLWSLRAPTSGRKTNEVEGSTSLFSSASASSLVQRLRGSRGGDALSILSGHGGRILCVKTAWHGDRLLSGGADRTIRIWDLVGSGEKCLNSLSGHFGWVTKVRYWGPNTIVSASTDRSIALWDARVRCSPLFMLRHHHCPISDLLVGSRTDPLMVSAASDGRVTTWDFRCLSGSTKNNSPDEKLQIAKPAVAANKDIPRPTKINNRQCRVVRTPVATMNLKSRGQFKKGSGPILLSYGNRKSCKTVLSSGSDGKISEWEIATGRFVSEYKTGHCDMLSSFASLNDSSGLLGVPGRDGNSLAGTITSSWDGTVRVRKPMH